MRSDARSPRVFLTIDNCFASKRWTRPSQWMELVRQLGLGFVEASADTEADPLYCGEDYMERWVEEVSRCEGASGVKVANLYSGHGTYTTLGLGHTEESVRRRMLEQWVKPMIRAAAGLKAGLGFYCHAFPDEVLQDPDSYAEKLEQLCGQLSEVAAYAKSQGAALVGVEQMYSPHQVPWTIEGARDLIRRVYRTSGAPLYLTIDTGHQTGQARFARPEPSAIVAWAHAGRVAAGPGGPWLGSRKAQDRFKQCRGAVSSRDLDSLRDDMDHHPFLFSAPQDADTYAWLGALGCFSPIVHLQQVTGSSSSHLPFTAGTNRTGIIHADKVLRSLLESYRQAPRDDLPAPAKEIYLTLEIFAGAAETPGEIHSKLSESVAYWREYVPRDGMSLESLVGKAGSTAEP